MAKIGSSIDNQPCSSAMTKHEPIGRIESFNFQVSKFFRDNSGNAFEMRQEDEVKRIVSIIAVVNENDATATNLSQVSNHLLHPIDFYVLTPPVSHKCKFIACFTALLSDGCTWWKIEAF